MFQPELHDVEQGSQTGGHEGFSGGPMAPREMKNKKNFSYFKRHDSG